MKVDEHKIINEVSNKVISELTGKPNQEKDRKTLSPAFYRFLRNECESMVKLYADKTIREFSFWKFIKFKIKGHY